MDSIIEKREWKPRGERGQHRPLQIVERARSRGMRERKNENDQSPRCRLLGWQTARGWTDKGGK